MAVPALILMRLFKEILISVDECDCRVAVLEDGKLMEVLIDRDDNPVGRIYKGKVTNVFETYAFVNVGLERNSFLGADDYFHSVDREAPNVHHEHRSLSNQLHNDQELIVQVEKEALNEKGEMITTNVSLSGRYVTVFPYGNSRRVSTSSRLSDEIEIKRLTDIIEHLLPEGWSAVVRSAAAHRGEYELQCDMDVLIDKWHAIEDTAQQHSAPYLLLRRPPLVDWVARELLNDDVDRLLIDNEEEYRYLCEDLRRSAPNLVRKVHLYSDKTCPLFDLFGVETGIEEALQRKVQLKSGGNLVIERTEALWVIDVNTAQNTRKDAILLTNLEACREVCRQLRLRDMAGMIIVDFIDMESDDDKRRLLDCLGDELRKDRTRLDLVGMTELGLVQLTRKREGKDLDGMLRTECPLCHGYGKILSPKSAALSARREVLRLAPQHKHRKVIMSLSPEASAWFDDSKVIALEDLIDAKVQVVVDKYLWPDSFKVSFEGEGRA